MRRRAQTWRGPRAHTSSGAGRYSSDVLLRQTGMRDRGAAGVKRASTNGRPMRTREAVLPDAEQVHSLIKTYSGDGTLLPRTLAEICENIRDFVVLEHH